MLVEEHKQLHGQKIRRELTTFTTTHCMNNIFSPFGWFLTLKPCCYKRIKEFSHYQFTAEGSDGLIKK